MLPLLMNDAPNELWPATLPRQRDGFVSDASFCKAGARGEVGAPGGDPA